MAPSPSREPSPSSSRPLFAFYLSPAVARMSEKASMALATSSSSSKSIVEFRTPLPIRKKPNLSVLEEDDYVRGLEEIIQRDFFPDLPKLRAQHEYLTALENNDLERMREISLRYRTPSAVRTPHTPAPFETPLVGASSSSAASSPKTGRGAAKKRGAPRDDFEDDLAGEAATPAAAGYGGEEGGQQQQHGTEQEGEAPEKTKMRTDMSLDEYLNTYTSEDNASFDKILEDTHERLRKRHSWFFQKVNTQQLQLENGERKAKGEHYLLDTWKHEHQNALMYVPEEKPMTVKDLAEITSKPGVQIQHAATRFDKDIYAGMTSGRTRASGSRAGTLDAMDPKYRNVVFGHKQDGGIGGSGSPKVNGYGFVVTPSPAPGVDMDPLMTWGEIEGTPFRLDASDVQLHTSGPLFRIPDESYRDTLARQMMDKATSKRSSGQASKVGSSAASRSGSARGTPTDRVTAMSPAAQKLARTMGGSKAPLSFGSALRASYAGTAGHHTPGGSSKGASGVSGALGARSTPRSTPRASAASTPASTTSTTTASGGRRANSSESAPASEGGGKASITDDLLS